MQRREIEMPGKLTEQMREWLDNYLDEQPDASRRHLACEGWRQCFQAMAVLVEATKFYASPKNTTYVNDFEDTEWSKFTFGKRAREALKGIGYE